MSIFSSNDWPPSCSSANQSPINLTSDAKPCNLKCDLVMDTGDATQAIVAIEGPGLILASNSGLGSCKFKGESYLCIGLLVNHPSHHKINGIQADGEVIAIFNKPTGETLLVSSLFKVSSEQTPSYSFFKQFVPYAVPGREGNVMLKDWSIASMVAPGGYFVYQGSTIFPPCTPCEWVVFKQMINMDQGDFAYLVRNVEAGSREIQAVGDREVFFNDTENISGVMPHDGKFYLRLRPTGDSRVAVSKPSPPVNLKANTGLSETDKAEETENPTTIQGWFQSMYEKNGGWFIALTVITVLAVAYGIYLGYSSAEETPYTAEFGKSAALWTRVKLEWLWTYTLGIFSWLYDNTIGAIPKLLETAREAAKARAEAKPETKPGAEPETKPGA